MPKMPIMIDSPESALAHYYEHVDSFTGLEVQLVKNIRHNLDMARKLPNSARYYVSVARLQQVMMRSNRNALRRIAEDFALDVSIPKLPTFPVRDPSVVPLYPPGTRPLPHPATALEVALSGGTAPRFAGYHDPEVTAQPERVFIPTPPPAGEYEQPGLF